MEIEKSQKSQKNYVKYTCIICDYFTSNKTDYQKHNLTAKHLNNIKKQSQEICGNTEIAALKCSSCYKTFLTNSGLWKHRKKCLVELENPANKGIILSNETDKNEIIDDKTEIIQNTIIPGNFITHEMFMEVLNESKELRNVLIEQNKELQNKLIELASKQTNNTINSHNTNNNQFNLQFFLNETCKDAMNIVDFVNSLQLTTDDFETTGKLGFVEGISRIFIKELKKLNTEKLPIHCTDLKRETVYIKDNNIWEKENNEKQKLKWTIDRIAQLNLVQHHNWQEKYPVCIENNTKENEYFFKLAAVALGGKGEDEKDKYREKIMRNVLKEVVLDKQTGKQMVSIHP
jgi:hypothetical protein